MAPLQHYVETGTGEPLVLVMGLGAASDLWEPHVACWKKEFRCVAVDNRGAGKTPLGEEPLTVEAMAEDVAETIRSLGEGPVRVAGISMGSAIAQRLLLDHPDLVSKAVLIATWSRPVRSIDLNFQALDRAAQEGDARQVNTLLQSRTWSPSWLDAHPTEVDEAIAAPREMSHQAFRAQVQACRQFDALDELGTIDVPVLVTAGAQDSMIFPSLSRETAAMIPDARLIEFETGHVHHWEELEEFNERVLEWLR